MFGVVLGFGVFLVGSIIQGFAQLIFVESTAAYYRIPFSFLPFSLLAKGKRFAGFYVGRATLNYPDPRHDGSVGLFEHGGFAGNALGAAWPQ